MRSGGDSGPALIPNKPDDSLILRRMLGSDEPKMPPEDSPQPSQEEIEKIKEWIQQGAQGTDPILSLQDKWNRFPKAPRNLSSSITASALITPEKSLLGRFGHLDYSGFKPQATPDSSSPFIGKISQIRTDPQRKLAAISGGLPGLGGLVQIINIDALRDRSVLESKIQSIETPNDILYCAVVHPNKPWVATAGYDRTIRLWDYQTGSLLRIFEGHNGAVYDLDFDPSGAVLASASADETIKVWHVESGNRLDTLSQGEAEQLRVRFLKSTDLNGDHIDIVATGADRRIRRWRLPSLAVPAVSPMLNSIFAHEATIHQLAISSDQKLACTAAQDGTIKIWDTHSWDLIKDLPRAKDLITSVEWDPNSQSIRYATLSGGIQSLTLDSPISALASPARSKPAMSEHSADALHPIAAADIPTLTEVSEEPRSVQTAMLLSAPAKVHGILNPKDASNGGDWYAFDAKKDQVWSIETFAARDKSPLDSHLEITDQNAHPVLRTRLQAVRESYFTFRGKDSTTIDDFRLHRWEDMQLNEWLYAGGEVVRLWLYPRGPDSGFKVYPGFGNRFTYFGTSPIAHALNEPAWIVRELQPDQNPISNGLPVFPIYYSNDDDPFRRGGKDSCIVFQAPSDGRYFIRLRDTRGLGGDDFKYSLSIAQTQPHFDFKLETGEVTLRPDVGSEFVVSAERFDSLEGDIHIGFEQVPEGIELAEPLFIEKGQLKAIGQIRPKNSAIGTLPKEFEITLVAKSKLGDQELIATERPKLKVKINETPTMKLKIVSITDPDEAPAINKLTIRPGQTISAKLVIQRGELAGDIAFGGDDSGRNLPHGCFVDNIGLNGLLIPAGQSTREVFITAAPIVQPQRRVFHLRANVDGNPTSLPVELIVE